MSSISEVEETLSRIQSHKGVRGVLIINSEGVAIRSTFSAPQTASYAGLLSQLVLKARSVCRTIDTMDDLTFLRLRSRNCEIMVAPDKEYLLVVVQDPNLE